MSNFQSASNEHHTDKSRLILWLTILILACFITWAYFAEIDEITRAPGTVIASSRTQLIQSQDGGVLEQLLVAEGDVVKAGDLLARIDRTRAEAGYLEIRAKVASLAAKLARLRAEVIESDPVFPSDVNEYPELKQTQVALLRKRRAALAGEIESLQAIRELAQDELDLNMPLLKTGDVSRTEIIRLQREVAKLNSEITNKKNANIQDVESELSTTLEELIAAKQSLVQRKSLLDQTELYSPMRGIVKNVGITTMGGVVKPGEVVMEIVPLEDDLVIEAKIKPGDIAFLPIGTVANVKIDAYDYTIYGDLPGKLIFVSADTLNENLHQDEEPYYRARVRTIGRSFSGAPDRVLDIQPGMTAMVEIKTGKRTVFNYLLKPVVKTLSESLGER